MLITPDPFCCSSSELSVSVSSKEACSECQDSSLHWEDLLRYTSVWWAYNSAVRLWNRKLSCSPVLKSWFLTRGWAHMKRQGRDGMEPVCPLREPFGGDHTAPESHLTYTQPTVEITASPVLLWGGLVHAAIVQNRVHYFQFHFIMNI